MRSNRFSRRSFLAGAATVAGARLIPNAVSAMASQDPVLNSIDAAGKRVTRERVAWQVLPFPMKQVRLLPGPCMTAQEINRKYLHSLANDSLAYSFRQTAGLSTPGQPYGGWEKPDSELRGHFNGGHYLSAVALTYASTGDEDLKKKGDALVQDLAQCQQKSGYLSAFPTEFFDRLRERVRVWAPFYTIHKVMAGLLDMYLLTGNAQALDVVQKMATWVDSYTGPLAYEHMQRILGTEYGGMGEVLANLSAVTGRREYMQTTRRFEKKSFFDPLAERRDQLKGLHVNTHIPQVIAAARMYELTHDSRYRDIAQYFWDEVTSERSYCTGGTSNKEGWDTDPGKLSVALGPTTTEDCCAYNMMKLSRHLFSWSPEARFMDYYERLVFNHRLGTMDPETGTTMYYLPLQSGLWKTYGTQFDSFWCCSGTGVEEFAKLNDTIYFHDDNSVYVNLYIASELSWPEKGLKLRQDTTFPQEQGTSLTVTADRPADVAIRLRIPYWSRGGQVKINGRVLPAFASPASYLTLAGPWKTGDKIELSLPMHLHVAPMPDDESVQAVMYGPLVLAGRFNQISRDQWYGGEGPKPNPAPVPTITADLQNAESWVEPAAGRPLEFHGKGQSQPITLVPLSSIVHEQYAVYWKVQKG